jgi:tellurite methyltransferase
MTVRPFWERAYTDLHAATFGGPSQEIRDVVASFHPGSKALDLGCGEGRNSLFLAECGFDVTAVDISEAGIRKLDALAKDRSLSVVAEVADMREYRFRRQYDLIVSHGCLHLIERDSWQELIRLFKTYTTPGGINVVVVFTDTIPPPDDLRDYCLGLFREGELFTLYSDWESVLQRSYTLEDEHPGGLRHRHPVNKLVARRPSSSTLHDG